MTKKVLKYYLPIFGTLLFIYLGVHNIFLYMEHHSRAQYLRELFSSILLADALEDDAEAVDSYRSLEAAIPEVQLRILQRQWLIALEILHQIQAARFNRYLAGDLPDLYGKLNNLLDQMKERCNALLTEHDPLPNEIAWRAYNIRGAVRLLTSFIILENEKNWEKVLGTIKDAMSDLKSAIASVDNAGSSTHIEKNIPRWNLELLHGEQIVKKFQFSSVESEQRLELMNNLEAIIPEKGGYAPGEPLEKKIQK